MPSELWIIFCKQNPVGEPKLPTGQIRPPPDFVAGVGGKTKTPDQMGRNRHPLAPAVAS